MCCSAEEWEVPEAARRGGRGRKLQDPEGRFETRVKISDMRRCCILVSCDRKRKEESALVLLVSKLT